MDDLMQEVTLSLDAESRRLAEQLGADLRDVLAVEPVWAEPIVSGLDEHAQATGTALQAIQACISKTAEDVRENQAHILQLGDKLDRALMRLNALEEGLQASYRLVQQLNRPWYRRIFGG